MNTNLISTSLSLVLTSNSEFVDLNYPIHSSSAIKLNNAMIVFTNTAASLAAGSVIFADLGELTSHTRLNGNLADEQAIVLTNDITKSVTIYTPNLPVGTDRSVPTRILCELRKPDGSLIAGIVSVVLQFGIVFRSEA